MSFLQKLIYNHFIYNSAPAHVCSFFFNLMIKLIHICSGVPSETNEESCNCFYYIIFFPKIIFCQSSFIKGSLSDSTSAIKPSNAVISVLRQKDSSLVKFTRSDKNGNFEIGKLDSGSYLIMITYPKYGDYVDQIKLQNAQTLDLNSIYLTRKAKLLEAIIIHHAAMRIKGDTTEFTADSFHIKPNAMLKTC